MRYCYVSASARNTGKEGKEKDSGEDGERDSDRGVMRRVRMCSYVSELLR